MCEAVVWCIMYKHNATFYTIVLSVSSDANFIHTLLTDIHIGRIWNMSGKALVANSSKLFAIKPLNFNSVSRMSGMCCNWCKGYVNT